jgi:1-acyl-sn-glycerol-3-phosphate acyltransferase
MMPQLRAALDLFRQGCVIGGIAITTLLLYPWLAASRGLRYRRGQQLVPQIYHRIMRLLLGIRISVQGAPSSRRPLLIVANHTSWLDIVIISSFLPVVFVAQHEVASWPIFGWLAKLQRSIFVNRGRRHEVHATIDRIAETLAAGDVVGIFPEGTSTDGTDVLPFRSALIGAVGETLRRTEQFSTVFIQPVSLAYVGPNRQFAVWARENHTPFIPHLLQVIRCRRIEAALAFGDPVAADKNSDRKALARRLQGAVRQSIAEGANSRAS